MIRFSTLNWEIKKTWSEPLVSLHFRMLSWRRRYQSNSETKSSFKKEKANSPLFLCFICIKTNNYIVFFQPSETETNKLKKKTVPLKKKMARGIANAWNINISGFISFNNSDRSPSIGVSVWRETCNETTKRHIKAWSLEEKWLKILLKFAIKYLTVKV